MVPVILAIMLFALLAAQDDPDAQSRKDTQRNSAELQLPSTLLFGDDLLQMGPLSEPATTEWFGSRYLGPNRLTMPWQE